MDQGPSIRLIITILIGVILIGNALMFSGRTASISGHIYDELGQPVHNAVVRVQTTPNFTRTDEDGFFKLTDFESDGSVKITAWARGYYIAGGEEIRLGSENVELVLLKHVEEDNPDYSWLPSMLHPGEGENQGCSQCHSREGSELAFNLPVDNWLLDAHSQSALNTRFLNMYLGRDAHGNQSPRTRYGIHKDYGEFPLPPDPNEPYYGPGYKLDFPMLEGSCAACHAPLDAVNDPYGINPAELTGVATEGISCEFCHKIWDVQLDEITGLPDSKMPGVLSYEFRRPPEGHQFFAGPLDDVAPGEDTYLPLQQESQFCAGCHFGFFWDTLVYNSFGEWLNSTYSDPESGLSCQDCHMPSSGATHFVKPEEGGLERDPSTIFSHRMPGAMDTDLLENAVTMEVSSIRNAENIDVLVKITNDKTGHHVPTDSPLRQLILVVQAVDQDGNPLNQISGPVIPDWAGIGEVEEGYYAGMPGKAFAKILEELWTEISPTGAYWNLTRLVSDNRIPANDSDESSYSFEAINGTAITIEVKLLYRRAFKQLIDWKSWDVPDILMEHAILKVI